MTKGDGKKQLRSERNILRVYGPIKIPGNGKYEKWKNVDVQNNKWVFTDNVRSD